jgi:hypothetical protein
MFFYSPAAHFACYKKEIKTAARPALTAAIFSRENLKIALRHSTSIFRPKRAT